MSQLLRLFLPALVAAAALGCSPGDDGPLAGADADAGPVEADVPPAPDVQPRQDVDAGADPDVADVPAPPPDVSEDAGVDAADVREEEDVPELSCDQPDAGCPGTDICVNGQCIPCGCQLDRDCQEGQVCEECACEPACDSHHDCGRGYRCDMRTGHCIVKDWCECNNECPEGMACDAQVCVEPVPHDACGDALALESGVPVVASTRQATDRTGGTCSEFPSPEVVFTFEVAEPSGLRVLVDGVSDRFDATVYLRTNCTEVAAEAEEIACSDVRFSFAEQLEVEQVQPGTYWLYVESFGDCAEGDFTVTLEIVPGSICVGDGAEPNDEPARPGNLFQALGDDLHLCPGDVDWYAVNLAAGDEVSATLRTAEGTGTDGLELDLRRAGGEALPGELTRAGDVLSLVVEEIPAGGQHLLRVGHADPDRRADYTLDVEVYTAHGTCDCTNPTTLRAGITQFGNTDQCANDTAGTCRSVQQHTSKEIPYKFHIDETSHVTVTVEARWDYMVYMRRSCRSEAEEDEVMCEAPGDLDLPVLEAGTYYVFLDGRKEANGAYQLDLTVGPPDFPPDNDVCDAAEEIIPGRVVQGDTTYADDDYESFDASCTSGFGHSAPDVVYHFTLLEADTVRLTLAPTDFEAALYVRPHPCEQDDGQIMCSEPSPGGGPVFVQGELEPGTYYVFVDGYQRGRGPFELSFERVVPEVDE